MSVSTPIAAQAGSTLAHFTSPGLIIPYLRGQDAASVIQELSAALHREGRIPDLLQFYHRALNREYLCSTAIEPGWALPHAPVKSLDSPCFAVGRCARAIQWLAQSSQRVEVVFLLAVPETDRGPYLNVVAGLARLSKDASGLAAFMEATDAFGMTEALKQVRLRRDADA